MLTDLKIKYLPIPCKRQEAPDGKIGGLYLVVQPTGAKSWAVRYRAEGKPRKLTLGAYPSLDLATARRRAQEALGDVAGGKDPAGAKKAARVARKAESGTDKHRFDKIAASYLHRYVAKEIGEAWGAEIERQLKIEINPKIGHKQIGDVTKDNILELVERIVDRGSPTTGNRVFATLRQIFNWALDRDLITVSPMPKRAPAPETRRDRILDDAEIKLAWQAFEQLGPPFGAVGKLLLLTGARRDEIAEGAWSEIDLESRTWTIPAARTKNGEPHEIPLSDAVVEVLKSLPRVQSKAALVFTTNGRTPVSGFSKARQAIDAAVARISEAPIPRWTLHDLRRTAATNLQKLGTRFEVTEAVLNHRSGSRGGVAGIYQRHAWSAEKRPALAAWALVVDAIVSGASEKKLEEMRKEALRFVTNLNGAPEERDARIREWLARIDKAVTRSAGSNVVELAKVRS